MFKALLSCIPQWNYSKTMFSAIPPPKLEVPCLALLLMSAIGTRNLDCVVTINNNPGVRFFGTQSLGTLQQKGTPQQLPPTPPDQKSILGFIPLQATSSHIRHFGCSSRSKFGQLAFSTCHTRDTGGTRKTR